MADFRSFDPNLRNIAKFQRGVEALSRRIARTSWSGGDSSADIVLLRGAIADLRAAQTAPPVPVVCFRCAGTFNSRDDPHDVVAAMSSSAMNANGPGSTPTTQDFPASAPVELPLCGPCAAEFRALADAELLADASDDSIIAELYPG